MLDSTRTTLGQRCVRNCQCYALTHDQVSKTSLLMDHSNRELTTLRRGQLRSIELEPGLVEHSCPSSSLKCSFQKRYY